MKHLLLTTIAAVVLVGCGESQPPELPTAKALDISIHEAATDGNIKAVKQHIAAGADVNAKDDVGETPLHWAAWIGHKEIVELLITAGADVNAKGDDGTPLHHAALRGKKEIVEPLIANGADVNVKGGFADGTPLHYVVPGGHMKLVELLIADGADVNAKDEDGDTPLDWAIDRPGRTKTADLLRKHGGKTVEELKAAGN
jgi:ankyrin repeat protein